MNPKGTLCAVFLFVALCSACKAYKDCGSATGRFTNVKISNCAPSDSRCTFKKGTDVTVDVDFQSLTNSKSAKTVIHGVIAGAPIPFPFDKDDACKYGGIACPLKDKQSYKYSMTLPVQNTYPSLNLDVKLELQDENSKDLFCILIPVKIQ